MDGERDLDVPERDDGTPRVFWYDRAGEHMIYRRPDGSMRAIGFRCSHEVEVV